MPLLLTFRRNNPDAKSMIDQPIKSGDDTGAAAQYKAESAPRKQKGVFESMKDTASTAKSSVPQGTTN